MINVIRRFKILSITDRRIPFKYVDYIERFSNVELNRLEEYSYTFVAILCHFSVKASIDLLMKYMQLRIIILYRIRLIWILSIFNCTPANGLDLHRVDIMRLRVKLPYTQRCSTRYAMLSLVPYVRSLIVISRRRCAFMYPFI